MVNLGGQVYLLMARMILSLAFFWICCVFPTNMQPVCHFSVDMYVWAQMCVYHLQGVSVVKLSDTALYSENLQLTRKVKESNICNYDKAKSNKSKPRGDWAIICSHSHRSWLNCCIFSKSSGYAIRILILSLFTCYHWACNTP